MCKHTNIHVLFTRGYIQLAFPHQSEDIVLVSSASKVFLGGQIGLKSDIEIATCMCEREGERQEICSPFLHQTHRK